jgi:RHS repeat-associated protein
VGDYSFGFNGKDRESEFKSGAYDFGARIHDARLGRWMSVDPELKGYVKWSPYSFAFCNSINYLDLDGEKINWWRIRAAILVRNAMLKTETGTELWQKMKESPTRQNLHVTNKVLVLERNSENGDKAYDIVEGLTAPRMDNLFHRCDEYGVATSYSGKSGKNEHYKTDKHGKRYYRSVDVYISLGTLALERDAAKIAGVEDFNELNREEKSSAIASALANGGYDIRSVERKEGDLSFPFLGQELNKMSSIPENSIVGINPIGPAFAPNKPRHQENKQKFLNRVSVHEISHSLFDPEEIKARRNVESKPVGNENKTIDEQR